VYKAIVNGEVVKYTPKQIEIQITLLEIKFYKDGLTLQEVIEYNRLVKLIRRKKNELPTR